MTKVSPETGGDDVDVSDKDEKSDLEELNPRTLRRLRTMRKNAQSRHGSKLVCLLINLKC